MTMLGQIDAAIKRKRLTPLERIDAAIAAKADKTEKSTPGMEYELAIPEKTKQLGRGIKEIFTGAQRRTPETERLPELSFGNLAPNLTNNLKLAIGMVSSVRPEHLKGVLEKQIPDIKFRFDQKKNLIAHIPDKGDFVVNKPGFSKADAYHTLGQFIAFLPAARIAKVAVGLPRMLLGASAAGATEVGVQEVGAAVGAEDRRSFGDILMAMGAGIVGEGIPATRQAAQIGKARRLGALPGKEVDFSPSISEARKVQETLKTVTGVDAPLVPGQLTEDPLMLGAGKVVSQPVGVRVGSQAYKAQNIKAKQLAQRLLRTGVGVIEGTRETARKTIKKLETTRKAAIDPLYPAVWKENAKVDVKPVLSLIGKLKKESIPGGQARHQLARIARMIKPATKTSKKVINAQGKPIKTEVPRTIQQLHNVRETDIGKLLKHSASSGAGYISTSTRRKITQVNKALKEQMNDASSLYKDAQSVYEELTVPIKKIVGDELKGIDKSVVGEIAESELKNLTNIIFDPKTHDLSRLREVKKLIIKENPGLWDELIAYELKDQYGKLKPTGKLIDNVPKKMRELLLGNENRRAMLKEAMNPEMAKNFNALDIWLSRASLRVPVGAVKPEKFSRGEYRGVIGSLYKFLSKSPSKYIQNKKMKTLAKLAFDTEWQPRFTQIRKMNSKTGTAGSAMTQLVKDGLTAVLAEEKKE